MSDLPQDVLQVLLDEINQRRGLTLTRNDVVVGTPSPANSMGRNTSLQVQVPSIELSLTAYYHRLQMSVLFSGMNTVFTDEGETDVLELIPRIGARRGLTLDPNEFQSGTIDRSGATPTATLLPKATSLAFIGFLTLTLSEEEPEIPDDALLTVEGEPIYTVEDDFIQLVLD